jgi:hypothetical protein
MYFGHGSSTSVVILFAAVFVVRMVMMRRRRQMGGGRRSTGTSAFTGGPPPAPTGSGPTATVVEPTRTGMDAGWFPDPSGKFQERFWSGTAWTENVRRDGVPSTDAYPGGSTEAG